MCNHKKKYYKNCIKTPLETEIRNFSTIVKFYMYYAPNISSIHSRGRYEGEKADDLFNSMLNIAGMRKAYKFLQRFKGNPWEKFELDGEELCMQCPRMICKKFGSEHELTALLRHIRNAFAHGLIYIYKTQRTSYIVLEDLDTDKGPLTAKIVVTSKILSDWKAILEGDIPTGE